MIVRLRQGNAAMGRRLLLILFMTLPGLAWAAADSPLARLPDAVVDTTATASEGSVIRVKAGGNLQRALDAARPGDVIELSPGGVYRGPFTLPRKSGSAWITIRSAAGTTPLPGPGMRVAPEHSAAMAKLVSRRGTVIATDPGAHHYRFVGIEITTDSDPTLWQRVKEVVAEKAGWSGIAEAVVNLVELGVSTGQVADIPHHIIFDRCYLHGDARRGTRRGVALNSAHSAVVNSYLANFRALGRDSQAIAGWDGPGPYRISNNYLEGAGENLMFGGGDPGIHGMVPSDIEITRNHFAKPLSWKQGHADFEGTLWQVKNLLELKNARRVLIDGNLFEYNWPQAQNGFAILFTVRNQDGTAPWSVVEDVTFSNNVIRHVAAGINILGRDDIHTSQITRNIDIHNNLFEELGGEQGGNGRLLQLLDGIENIRIDRNSAFAVGHVLLSEGDAHSGLVISRNLILGRAESANHGAGSGRQTILVPNTQDKQIQDNLTFTNGLSRYPGPEALNNMLNHAGFEFAVTAAEETPVNMPGVRLQALCRAMSDVDRPQFCSTEAGLVPSD